MCSEAVAVDVSVCSNLSSLYFQMGEMDAATESARRGLEVPVGASAKFRAKLLIQAALIQFRQGSCERAAGLTREAIEVSRAQLDVPAEAQAWNELGNALLECKQLPGAERALLESFRLRKLTHDDRLHFSYEALAGLRMAQHDPAAALGFLNRAVEAAAPLGSTAVWRPLFARGRCRADGNVEFCWRGTACARRRVSETCDFWAQIRPCCAQSRVCLFVFPTLFAVNFRPALRSELPLNQSSDTLLHSHRRTLR